MIFLTLLPMLVLAANTAGSPIIPNDDLVINSRFFLDSFVKYTAQHDIVNLVVPLNKLNFDDDDDSSDEDDKVTLFFVEADINDKGERQYQGLYIYQNDTATKLLDNGRGAAAFNDESKKVFLAASDGIYIYNSQDGKVNKIDTVTDSIVQVEADNQTSVLYYLTEDHKLFSLNNNGDKTEVEAVKNAQEFIIDFISNIYYYNDKNELFVFNQDGVKKFEGVSNPNAIKLVRPMFAQDDGIFGIVDNTLYLLHPNGTAEKSKLTFDVKPTAYAPEATLLQYYAYNKKIYEFNVIEILLGGVLAELKEFLDEKKNEIETIATKSRSAFGV